MRKLPPLRSLQAFEAVARHRSFKDAAHELNVTPTALSHQIRTLEEACGRQLFARRPRPIRLTAAGRLLYPALRRGFDSFADALSTVAEMGGTIALRITSPNAFASRWLVPRLSQWHESHPDSREMRFTLWPTPASSGRKIRARLRRWTCFDFL